MKSYDIIRTKWLTTFDSPSISLQTFKDRGMFGSSCTEGLRSVCWKVYLDCLPSLDTSAWSLALQQQRQYYEGLKKKFIFDPNAEETAQKAQNLAINNPLSLDQESPWIQYFKDGELRKVIKQDVERTFPDYEYFHSSATQTRLTDMLFIYCKLHEDVSYRQGMHELLAPILQIVDEECLDITSMPTEDEDVSLELIKEVLHPDFVEHDAFSLFTNLMKSAKQWYEFNDELSNQRTLQALKSMGKSLDESNLLGSQPSLPMTTNQTPIMITCNRIHHELLKTFDPQLYAYLESLQIEPQLYGIRWLRLLFGREFPLEELPRLWDGIFADGSDLGLVDYICVAMLLYIREDLLAADYAMCLHRIMKFPSVPDPTLFVKQALHLRDHPSFDGGSKIIFQNARDAGRQAPTLFNYPNEASKKAGNQRPRRTQSDSSGSLTVPKSQAGRTHPPRKRDEAIAHINKAMHDIKKTVNPLQSYLKRTLSYNQKGHQNTPSNEPDFQSIYEHAIPQPSPITEDSTPGKSKSNDGSNSLSSPASFEIGSLLDRCIDMLEKGIFGKSFNLANENSGQSTPSKSSEIVKNEMDIVIALVGLKHVRDVLTQVTSDLNPDILNQQWPHEGDDHWELVEHQSDSEVPPLQPDVSALGVIVEASSERNTNEADKGLLESPNPADTNLTTDTIPQGPAFVDLVSNDWKSSDTASPEPYVHQDPWRSEPESYSHISPFIENTEDEISRSATDAEFKSQAISDALPQVSSLTAPPKRTTHKIDVLSSLESILAEDERSPSTPNRFSTNPNYNWIFHGNKEASSNIDSCASVTFTRSESEENLGDYTASRMSQSLDLDKERKLKNLPVRTKKLVGKSVSDDSDDPLKSRDVDRRNLRILDDYA